MDDTRKMILKKRRLRTSGDMQATEKIDHTE